MTRAIVRLVERRTREVRLPRDEAAFLLAHARHLVEVVPAFRGGVYRLTARGWVGWFDSLAVRYSVSPKIPWPNVRMLLGLPTARDTAGAGVEPDAGLLDVLAREFVALLRDVIARGLVPGYREQDTTATFLRGKLRAADQLRDAAARAFPDRFHVTESVLDLDTPWNRVPRSIAETLLSHPELSPASRAELRDAVIPLAGVTLSPVSPADFEAATSDRRTEHYRVLLALCRFIHDGLTAAQLPHAGGGAFVVELSRAFERYLADGLAAELAQRTGWQIERHPAFLVGPTPLQPDILLRRRGESVVVLDAKWKSAKCGPDPADLHQILAYSAVTGARHVGLVYPGTRSARRALAVPGSDVTLSLLRVRVVGTVAECRRSLSALARLLLREPRG